MKKRSSYILKLLHITCLLIHIIGCTSKLFQHNFLWNCSFTNHTKTTTTVAISRDFQARLHNIFVGNHSLVILPAYKEDAIANSLIPYKIVLEREVKLEVTNNKISLCVCIFCRLETVFFRILNLSENFKFILLTMVVYFEF